MEKKNLRITAATVDARHTQEETLAQYGSIQINAATIITTSASRKLLGQYGVHMNTASVLDLPEACEFTVKNGAFTCWAC